MASVNITGLIFQFRDTPIDGPESLGDLEVVVVLATGSGNLTAAAAPVIIQVQTVPGGTATGTVVLRNRCGYSCCI